MIIGLEGPAGSGKTTMARTVAAEIGAVVMESGIWYRALALLALRAGIAPSDTVKLVNIAKSMDLKLSDGAEGRECILLGNEDVTDLIYGGDVSATVAIVAHELPVREVVKQRFTAWTEGQPAVIVVGRHLKRVFPDAPVMRLVIDPLEAERRHEARASTVTHRVEGRNALDQETAALLGVTRDGVTEIDVTNMTPDEQADALRDFIHGSAA